jgi:alpha-mannosidase
VLIVAGDGAVAAVVDDLDDAEIVVNQDVPGECGDFESRTVALLNRGVPGFAVERDGTLHTSLMRSCTGWPSGTWIDPPARKAPDGSNFQLQHWSHTFDFALVTGDGDWRATGMPWRSAEFNHPLICVPVDGGTATLPADGSLLSIEPAGQVMLGALKAAGNPTATGSAAAVDPEEVTLRLVETTGGPTRVALSSAVADITDVAAADLLEIPRADDDPHRLHGYQIATVRARLRSMVTVDDKVSLGPDAEPAQPLYARYWLHNRGPAPLGGLPAVAHLHPETAAAEPGQAVRLRLSVASDCSDATLGGGVRLRYPQSWGATDDTATRMWAPRSNGLAVELEPRGHTDTDITIAIPPDAAPGVYPVRAQFRLGGKLPPSWQQTVEDVCVITVGEPGDVQLIRLTAEPSDIVVARGGSARLSATVATDALGDLAVEAHLISPWGTWEWIGPASCGAVLPAASSVQVGFDITPPRWLTPGVWWALIRIGCAGRLLYTPAVAVTVI